jgi:hypothetical protein
MPGAAYDEITRRLREQGYDPAKLVKTAQKKPQGF